jgi:hypothetical protein
MLRTNVLAISIFTAIALTVHAAPQADSLGQQVHSVYLETSMDPNGMKVIKPGSTLVVQIDGIQANPLKNNLEPFENTYKDGQISATEKKSGLKGMLKKQVKIGLHGDEGGLERPLANGAKVYLLKMEFGATPDAIGMTVQTCGDCDPKSVDPMNTPYRAKVTFQFVKGALGVTDLKHVQQAIEQVFKFADTGAADTGAAAGNNAPANAAPQNQQAAAPPPPPAQPAQDQQQFSALAPPPPPPPEPRTLKIGMTVDEVKASYGEPANIVDLGNDKMIYMYKDKKITFVKGKVSDVDVL